MTSGPDLDSWRYWWGFHRDRFLELKHHVGLPDGVVTPEAIPGSLRPAREELARDVVPALLQVVAKESSPMLVASAAIALAVIGEEPDSVYSTLVGCLPSGNRMVSESATISLGILGTPGALVALVDLLGDTEEGRRLCARREVPWRTRATAAYGIGLAGGREGAGHARVRAQDALLRTLAGPDASPTKDVGVATVLSLAMIPDPERRAISALRRWFAEHQEREKLVCAHVAPALGRLLANGAAPDRTAFAEEMATAIEKRDRKSDRWIVSGQAIALGLVTRAGDPHAPRVARVLQDLVEKDRSRNALAADFAMMALGEIAATGAPGGDLERALLQRATATGGRVSSRAWAALALGVAGHGQAKEGRLLPDDPVGGAMLAAMRDIQDPDQQAAFAVGLGLRRHLDAAPHLRQRMESVNVDESRGFFALGLGLMGARESRGAILDAVRGASRRPALLKEAAIGLALLGDKDVVDVLVGSLEDPENRTFVAQAAVADALGYVGDRRAVAPLLRALRDEDHKRTDSTRVFAAVALGLIGDRDEMPWNSRISMHFNYPAFVETLFDLIWES
ncbi:MAG TPA: HEAT repeat domain-containing protein [Planctomycetota bacterium]|nr:HEAT repeat domain-containing protein [Planctomycetota bacterium]